MTPLIFYRKQQENDLQWNDEEKASMLCELPKRKAESWAAPFARRLSYSGWRLRRSPILLGFLLVMAASGIVLHLSTLHMSRLPERRTQTTENRTLVIVMGSIRGGELAWQTLYRNVLDLNSADLALVVGEVAPENRTSSLYGRAKYLYEFLEFNDWGTAIDLINGTAWRDELLPYVSKGNGLFGAVDGRKGSGAVIFMARWYVSKAIEEYGLKERYDRFVLTRSDHYYGCEHDLSLLDPSFVWVPIGQDFGGITDRHMICNNGQILKALDIFPTAIRHPTKYADSRLNRTNPEKMIARRWKEENLWDNVRRFDRVMFTCAAAGDKTRWKGKSKEKAEEGVFLKYKKEYKQTKCICGASKWDEATVTCASS